MKSNLFLGLTVHLLYAITIDLLVHRPAQTIQLDHEMGNNPGPWLLFIWLLHAQHDGETVRFASHGIITVTAAGY